MRHLSKSKLIAYRQCPKRLWLAVHKPEERIDSSAAEAGFAIGHAVGEIARRLYDPRGKGVLIDAQKDGYEVAFEQTRALLDSRRPIFEAGFKIDGAMAFADVLLPGKKGWRMVEVKSSGELKGYHLDDAAIQAYVARQSGLKLAGVAVAHLDKEFVYPGGGDYRGLLQEHDLTDETLERADEVRQWIAEAQTIVTRRRPPTSIMGRHCVSPFECGFRNYCAGQRPVAEHPVQWLPLIQLRKAPKELIRQGVSEMRDMPDTLLTDEQRRVKRATLNDKPYFNAKGARAALAKHAQPALFMDFETTLTALPQWAGTRPYQFIPFQFSLHRLKTTGRLEHAEFLSLEDADPSRAFAEALVRATGVRGTLYVYNASFESSRLRELAARFPDLAPALEAIIARIVDLHPITKEVYYHPSQQGSWSLKRVLPAIAPDLSYQDLEGIQEGMAASEAYLEAIHPDTPPERKAEIAQQLRGYCKLDTYALVLLWRFLSGRKDLEV